MWRIYSELVHRHGQREAGTDGKVKEALMTGIERMELNKKRSAGGKGELTRNQLRPVIAVTD